MSAHSLTNSPELESRPWLATSARVLSKLSDAALWVAGIGLMAMSVIVLWQVFLRYVLNGGQAWPELSSILNMSWFIFPVTARGIPETFHLGFVVLRYVLPPGRKELL